MNLDDFYINLPKPKQDGACNHLLGQTIPSISLPNQDQNSLNLQRIDRRNRRMKETGGNFTIPLKNQYIANIQHLKRKNKELK